MLTAIPWQNISWAVASLVIAPALIIFVRRFGNFENKIEGIGSDLNLIGFGFAIELIIAGARSKSVLENWPYASNDLKWVLVIVLLGLNLFLYMINLKTADNLRTATGIRASVLKGLSMFLGLLSAVSYVTAKGFWE